jgi:hypothetical protein
LSSTDAASANVKAVAPGHAQEASAATVDRRADVDAKQEWIARLLAEYGCEFLLVRHPANLAWLTCGAATRGLIAPEEQPLLCYSATQRWLVCGNFESQRMFDQELDGLGFLLKEWPWHTGRDRVLADLCRGRNVAVDEALADLRSLPSSAKLVGDQIRAARMALSLYEQACLRQLGKVMVHALEATGRSCNPGETERELAGQVAHRLLRYGATPIAISVVGDGRSRGFRRYGFTSQPVTRGAILSATARKYGMHVTAARSFHFGKVEDQLKEEQLAACRVAATYLASSWPDAVPHEILVAAQRVYRLTNFEHEWEKSPQGYLTGRCPVERPITPELAEVLRAHLAITWGASIGAALSQDTLLVTEAGPRTITPTESWATAAIKVHGGEEFVCPYILER